MRGWDKPDWSMTVSDNTRLKEWLERGYMPPTTGGEQGVPCGDVLPETGRNGDVFALIDVENETLAVRVYADGKWWDMGL
jgi:hypothetical protein